MNEILKRAIENKAFTNSKKEVVKIHSHTNLEQCLFLQKIIQENNFKKSIEIGFAYGLSSLAISEAIFLNGGTRHTVIDKFENTDWGGNGIDLLRTAGLDNLLDFKEEFCYIVLPQLLKEGETFDFAYVDSTKQFDWILTDFFYLDKLLINNGIIVFDDVNYPGIRKVARFISRLSHYKVYSQHIENRISMGKQFLKAVTKFVPLRNKIIRNDLIDTDYDLKINAGCIAFQKIKNDERKWNWNIDF